MTEVEQAAGKVWFKPSELARRWGVDSSTVRRWCAMGKLHSMRTDGRQNRVSREEIARWEALQTRRAARNLPQ